MFRNLVHLLRRALGTQALLEIGKRQEALMRNLAINLSPTFRARAPTDASLEILPGTPYARYALPLEYPPSRDLRPRYGNTQPLL